MNPWTALVDVIERAIHATAGLAGGATGLGIFLLTLAVRCALIPIMLPLAQKTRRWRAIHRSIKPEIDRINREFKSDPGANQRELKALHKQHGIGIADGAGLLAALIQVPILIAFFQAVLHISEGTALASGGLVWGLIAGAVSFLSTMLGDATTPRPLLYLSGLLPVVICIWLGAGVGFYLIAFYLGSLIQSLLLRARPAPDVTPPAHA
jgi:YidC/Oxa1 family membrane protein insertase